MTFNIREVIGGENEGEPRRRTLTDPSLVFIWSAIEFLKSHSAFFNSNGFEKINDRSIVFLENAENQLLDGQIDVKHVSKGVSEWLVALILREPKYVITMKYAVNYQYKKIVDGPVGELFIDTLLEGPFFNWAQKILDERETYRQATKNVIEDYINVRQKASENVDVKSKTSQRRFSCFLSSERIELLYKQLVDLEFIPSSISLETFREVFNGKPDKFGEPILWLKKTVSLVYLFHVLDEKQSLIDRRWQTLLGEKKQAFKNKYGLISTSNFSSVNRNVRQSINHGKRVMFQYEIDTIIENMLSIKS